MQSAAHLVTDLAVVLGVAAITSVLARKAKQPPILGFLLAGVVVGPYLPIPLFADTARVHELSELGVVLVMFAVGLEFRIKKLGEVLPTSGLTGLVQVSFLWWCGVSLGQLLGWSLVDGLFLGASMAISSTMVVSKVFAAQPIRDDVRNHVLGVLVIQDVIAMALIAAMTAIAAGGGLQARELAAVLGRLGAVLTVMLIGGLLIVPRAVRFVLRQDSAEVSLVFSVGLCFVFAWLASALGFSVALGAFLAGMLVAESGKGEKVEHLVAPLRDLFAAIFFVSIGMTVDPRQVLTHLPVSLLVSAVVIAAQLLSVSIAGVLSGLGLHRSVMAGLALGQVGEFGFILAGIGIGAGAARESLQPILVTVAVLTTFSTPAILARGEHLVAFVDGVLPARVARLLVLYEAWFARLRAPAEAAERGPIRRALRAIALDGVGLIALAALAAGGAGRISAWLAPRLGQEPRVTFTLALAVAGVLALPLVVGAVRNSALLAKYVAAKVDDAEATRRASRILVHVLVLLGVGLPALAVLRPLIGQIYALPLVLVAVAAGTVIVLRSAGSIDAELRSGAERMAGALARAAYTRDSVLPSQELAPEDSSVVGLGTTGVRVPDGAFAVGKTLAILDLRAKSGATVVSIQRGDARVILPTGHEAIEAGDILAIVGAPDALGRARDLVLAGGAGA